jgi:glycosyltransferase involved in cell wall biosynthesis
VNVSVLIDTYNSMPYVGACVDSALNQTRAPDEIVVSDDGSDDGTWKFLEARYRGRIQLVASERVPGRSVRERQAASIANAFAHSTGDLVLLLDGDDLFLPGRVERYEAVMKADASIAMVQSPLRHVDADGNALPQSGARLQATDDLLAEAHRRNDLDCFCSTSGLGFRRTFLERVLPLDLSDGLGVWTDDRLCIAALLSGKAVTLADETGCWRRRAGSVTAGLFKERAFLARLALDRARLFNRLRGPNQRPISVWRSSRFYLRWLRAGLKDRMR